MFDVSKFRFSTDGIVITACNGPIVLVFDVTPTGLSYQPVGSNVTLDWEHFPAVALAIARANRRAQREIATIGDAALAAISIDRS